MKKKKLPNPIALRQRMETNAIAHHKDLAHLVKTYTNEELLALCHPDDREDFKEELNELGNDNI